MTWLIDFILGPAGAALGGLVVIVVTYLSGKSSGKKGAQNDAMRDTQDRTQKGREALRAGRGDDPSERLRRNDGKW